MSSASGSRSRGRGSAKASRSSVSRSSVRGRSSTWAVRSRTAGVIGTGPRHAHWSVSGTGTSRPLSRTAASRWRSSRRSPRHRRCNRSTVSGSREVSAPAASSSAVSSRGSGSRARRGSSSPDHSRDTASGTEAPSVATTRRRVRPCTASWCTRAADAESSRCASSTSSSRTPDRRCTARCRVIPSGSRWAKAAKGTSRVSGVPAARARSVPRTASVTSLVLPAPAGPVTTRPPRPAATDPRTSSSSSARPVNGQGVSSLFASRREVVTAT